MLKFNHEKFLQEINSKWVSKDCPMCHHNNWQVDKNLVTSVRLSESGKIELGGNVMPLVAVTCMHCGNVIFVNSLVLKSVDISESEEKS